MVLTEDQVKRLNEKLFKIVIIKLLFGFPEPKIGIREFKHLVCSTTHMKRKNWWKIAKELENRGIIKISRNYKSIKINLPFQALQATLRLKQQASYMNQHTSHIPALHPKQERSKTK